MPAVKLKHELPRSFKLFLQKVININLWNDIPNHLHVTRFMKLIKKSINISNFFVYYYLVSIVYTIYTV